jgi:muconolactone delta-isomerase
MEFLVEFKVAVPDGTAVSVVKEREEAEASAATKLADEGRLVRVWRPRDGRTILGLYRAEDDSELESVLASLPLRPWMDITVTALEPHPNDPAATTATTTATSRPEPTTGHRLPDPCLSFVYRLQAALGAPMDVGVSAQGRRRIVALTGGTFSGPRMAGELLPGASADWQVIQPDGTTLGDIRYTLRTDGGDLLSVRSHSVRHGSAEVLARLARGEDVEPSEYTFRASTRIETAAPELDWLNRGIFVSVAGRQAEGVVYETYLVS